MDPRPIGVFDSGFGGLTAVRQLRRIMPSETIIYFGDTARVPYGNRSRDTLLRYARQDVAFLRALRPQGRRHRLRHRQQQLPPRSSRRKTRRPRPGRGGARRPPGRPPPPAAGGWAWHRHPGLASPAGPTSELFRRLAPGGGGWSAGPAPPLRPPGGGGALPAPGDPVIETVAGGVPGGPPAGWEIDTLVLGCTHYPLLAGGHRPASWGRGWPWWTPAAAAARAVRDRWLAERDALAGGADQAAGPTTTPATGRRTVACAWPPSSSGGAWTSPAARSRSTLRDGLTMERERHVC